MAHIVRVVSFEVPAVTWRKPLPLQTGFEPGCGCDAQALRQGLTALAADPTVQALVVFGSRAHGQGLRESDLDLAVICRDDSLSPELKTDRSFHYRQLLGDVGCGVDLVVQGWRDADHLAGSRWHVMGDVARHGQVLYVAS